jgi:AraC-like DNA-binding protein
VGFSSPVHRLQKLDRDRESMMRGGAGARLVPAADVAAFMAAPIGHCIVGPQYLIWCDAPDLQGVIVWGELDARAIHDMMAIGRFIEHSAIARRRRVLVDCRDIERVDAEVLLGFTEQARDRVPVWADDLERQAIVVPSGLGGILLAGALPSLGVAHPLRFALDLETALAFIDHPGARAAHEAATHIVDDTRGHATLLFRLRAHLGRDLAAATVDDCATSLGMSTRTLQRALGRLETSFSDELRRVRVTAAEALLVHSDLKIDSIANQVGFGTASRMSATLRRERNVTASALRARARG